MDKRIRAVLKPNGEVTVEAVGFQGEGCAEATRSFREALGLRGEEQLKPEYYETAVELEKLQ